MSPGDVSPRTFWTTQIPQFRLVVQIRLPVLGASGKRPLFKLSADTMLADLHRLGWRTGLVFHSVSFSEVRTKDLACTNSQRRESKHSDVSVGLFVV